MWSEKDEKCKAVYPSNLLVIDFGGGTLDLSLVRLDKSIQSGKKPLGFLLKWGQKSLTESGQKVKTARKYFDPFTVIVITDRVYQ